MKGLQQWPVQTGINKRLILGKNQINCDQSQYNGLESTKLSEALLNNERNKARNGLALRERRNRNLAVIFKKLGIEWDKQVDESRSKSPIPGKTWMQCIPLQLTVDLFEENGRPLVLGTAMPWDAMYIFDGKPIGMVSILEHTDPAAFVRLPVNSTFSLISFNQEGEDKCTNSCFVNVDVRGCLPGDLLNTGPYASYVIFPTLGAFSIFQSEISNDIKQELYFFNGNGLFKVEGTFHIGPLEPRLATMQNQPKRPFSGDVMYSKSNGYKVLQMAMKNFSNAFPQTACIVNQYSFYEIIIGLRQYYTIYTTLDTFFYKMTCVDKIGEMGFSNDSFNQLIECLYMSPWFCYTSFQMLVLNRNTPDNLFHGQCTMLSGIGGRFSYRPQFVHGNWGGLDIKGNTAKSKRNKQKIKVYKSNRDIRKVHVKTLETWFLKLGLTQGDISKYLSNRWDMCHVIKRLASTPKGKYILDGEIARFSYNTNTPISQTGLETNDAMYMHKLRLSMQIFKKTIMKCMRKDVPYEEPEEVIWEDGDFDKITTGDDNYDELDSFAIDLESQLVNMHSDINKTEHEKNKIKLKMDKMIINSKHMYYYNWQALVSFYFDDYGELIKQPHKVSVKFIKM